MVVPWSGFWDRNFFAGLSPLVDAVMASPYTRGAVSGVGLVTLLAGLSELVAGLASKREAASALPPRPTLHSDR